MSHRNAGQRDKSTDMTRNSRVRLIEMIRSGMTNDEIVKVPLMRNNGTEVPICRRYVVQFRNDLTRRAKMHQREFEAMMLGVAP